MMSSKKMKSKKQTTKENVSNKKKAAKSTARVDKNKSTSKKDFRILLFYPNLHMSALMPQSIGIFTSLLKEEGYMLDLWEKNCAVHEKGMQLIRPGATCSDIATELNEMYREGGLLQYRSFGYGHSFGVLSHYYGREAAVLLGRELA